MAHFISNEINNYIKDKYNIDLEKDENVSLKSYNPHICQARYRNQMMNILIQQVDIVIINVIILNLMVVNFVNIHKK